MNEGTWAWVFYYVLFFAIAFGMMIGSFLNVVIYRVPEGLSVVSPGSRCPKCETPIRWYDNIPVFSWIFLGGTCRTCKVRISPRYALVEALVGVIAGVTWWQLGSDMLTLPLSVEVDPVPLVLVFSLRFTFAALLVVIAFVDLDHFIIPHKFTLPGMALGLASPWILQAALGNPDYLGVWPPVTPLHSIIAFVFGGVAVVAIFYLYLAARGIEGLGGGDVTLMALVGAWLGLPGVIFVFFAASLQGLIAAGLTMLLGIEFVKDSAEIFDDEEVEESVEPSEGDEDEDGEEEGGMPAVPFGPFISLAALEYMLFGQYLPPEVGMHYIYFYF